MRNKLLLVASLLTLVILCATRALTQDPAAGVTKLSAEGVGTGNTSAASGTLRGDPMGTATWTLTYTPGTFGQNGQGGNCDFGSGNITIATADGSALNMQHGGLSCNTGVGGASPAIDNTVYTITSGTGRFSNAQGVGNVALSWSNVSNPGPVFVHFTGNIDLQ